MLLIHANLRYAEKKDLDANKIKDTSLPSAAARLDEALELRDMSRFMAGLSQAIHQAGGYAVAAKGAGLNRTALYKIVSANSNPSLHTLLPLLTYLGLRLSVQPIGNVPGGSESRSNAYRDEPEVSQGHSDSA
jgi:DNA-binding phage protein